ncbi:MAG: ACP S-malonyltransferase [Gammaproteobacteria bacterium]|nr:ACP S-malonyltransferase [Gammaproteobacteria bacterium]
MSDFGFVFPGQGSQHPGMLSDLANKYPIIQQTFIEASDVLGKNLWTIAQDNPNNELNDTSITQPVLMTASVAIWRLWQMQGGLNPALLSGHSLGEYSALVCAEAISFSDAIKLVHQRGLYMQEAVPAGVGKMAAILGLDAVSIETACNQSEQYGVASIANYNSPGQIVIAGDAQAVDKASALCTEAGAKRIVELNVSVPSHCELMKPAADKLKHILDTTLFQTPRIPIVQNVDAERSDSASAIKDRLINQLFKPVLWIQCLAVLRQAGCTSLVECGPGKILSGLTKRSEPTISSLPTHDLTSISIALAHCQDD